MGCGNSQTTGTEEAGDTTVSVPSLTSGTSTVTAGSDITAEELEIPPSDVAAACAEGYGQDLSEDPPAEPGFVACLKRQGAPPEIIEAWTGG